MDVYFFDFFDYLFNANNMRVKKSTSEGTTLYGWENNRIFAEYDDSGNAIQETVYSGSTPIALLKDDQTYRIFADQIDTPRVISNTSNTTLWAWESKPFGESKPNEDIDGDDEKLSYNLRFPGQYYDTETEKHYNFNRDYDPVTGRYVQSDPIGLNGGINTYTYVLNDPISYVDQDGLRCSWRQKLFLQGAVNAACKWSGSRKCTKGDSCFSNGAKIAKNSACITARKAINNKCFKGGDAGHKQAVVQAKNALNSCLKLRAGCCR